MILVMDTNRLRASLFLLRLSTFVVMLHWTLEKFIRPEHTIMYYEKFYFISGLTPEIMYILGIIELIFIIGFLIGILKPYTYGFVLIIQIITTLTYISIYFEPFDKNHLLFFASWPMLAACVTLFLLKDEDSLCSFGKV